MLYKQNWPASRERLLAFWEREYTGRPSVSVQAPIKKGIDPFAFPDDPDEIRKCYLDGKTILSRYLRFFENTYFGGESFPVIWPNFGTAGHAKYFKGANYHFDKNTVWFTPSIEDISAPPEYDGDGSILAQEEQTIAYLAKAGMGEFFVSMPDDCGSMDALSHLRGSQNLLFDLIDEPEAVEFAMERIVDAYIHSNDRLFDIIKANNRGGSSHGWMHTYSEGRHAQLQCDFAVMLSPELFERFVMPELTRCTKWLEHSIYHFDGEEQIRHLDLLLSIKELDAIQWSPVEGQPSCSHYIPQLLRIQQSGKGLVLFPRKDEIPVLLRELSSKGLHMVIRDALDPQEADDIVRMCEKLSHS